MVAGCRSQLLSQESSNVGEGGTRCVSGVWVAMRSVGAAPEAQTRLVSTGLEIGEAKTGSFVIIVSIGLDSFDAQSIPPD